MTMNLSSEPEARRQSSFFLNAERKKKKAKLCQPRILYSAKIFLGDESEYRQYQIVLASMTRTRKLEQCQDWSGPCTKVARTSLKCSTSFNVWHGNYSWQYCVVHLKVAKRVEVPITRCSSYSSSSVPLASRACGTSKSNSILIKGLRRVCCTLLQIIKHRLVKCKHLKYAILPSVVVLWHLYFLIH